MFHTLLRSTALAAGLFLTLPVLAADKLPMYDVEVLVFARPSADIQVERWPDRSELSPREDVHARVLAPARSASAEPFQRLPASALRLTREYERLVAAADLEPVLHLGWIQPGLAREQSAPVRIEGSSETGGSVDGVLRIILARYLHVEADLRYRRPEDARDDVDGTDILQAPQALFRLQESRRMRSKEIHYLDHPLFGAIVLITPRDG